MNAVILPDGNVSLPPELREALGLVPGTVLEIQNDSGRIVAWKKQDSPRDKNSNNTGFTFSLPGGPITSEQVWASLEDDDD